MKRSIVMIIVASMLFSQSGLRELVKLPALWLHYLEHVEDRQDLSFTDFIHEHYDAAAHCEKSDGHHADLPFKDVQCCISLSVCAIIPSITELSFRYISTSDCTGPAYSALFVTGALDSIWQPPG